MDNFGGGIIQPASLCFGLLALEMGITVIPTPEVVAKIK